MITEKTLESALKGTEKDIQLLIDFYNKITSSPYYQGYISLSSTIEKWNLELQSENISILGEDKAFANAHKYLSDINIYYDKLQYFREKLNPVQIEQSTTEVKNLLEKVMEKRKNEK